jgi:uncharacterized SAM-binding protein YcdF (DUF218 family)
VAIYAAQNGWKRILLVTSPYHMKRARYIFERLGHASGGFTKPVGIETLSVYQDPFDANEWRSSWVGIRVTILEYFKWIYYRYVWKP